MNAMQAGDFDFVQGLISQGMGQIQQGHNAQGVLDDALQVRTRSLQLDRMAKTLELVYNYNVSEQVHPFKSMMKLTVRRAITNGVGYVKLGYQRVMERRPDTEAQISDFSAQLAVLQRRAADFEDKEIDESHPEIAHLQDQLNALGQGEHDILVREGLVFDYPASTSIIPDPKTIQLRDFLGARWVAQEYIMTPDQIKETYDVDVTTGGEDGMLNYHAYRNAPDSYNFADGEIGSDDNEADSLCTVWEIYSKTDGVVYHVCDGYPDYLREPAPPQIKVERFYPWFGLIFNECVHETDIFPPSDVDLIRDMQSEMNRAREGLREHRIANKPKHVVAGGKLSHDDKEKLQEHPPNAIIELDALQPQEKVTDLLQPYSGASIDPNLYETASIYEDVLRVTGTQEANLGGVSGATATETHIAETSRMSSVGSNIDELDDMLTQMARASGQILLLETDVETARKIAGPGALWPDMTREDVVEEIYLEIEAGSTGKPSKAMEVQNAERLVPLLQNIPGISPEWMAKELIRRMDDRVDMTSAFSQGVPSIVAMNAMNGIANTQGLEGQDQGVQGSNNAEQTGAPPGGMGAPNDPGAHTG